MSLTMGSSHSWGIALAGSAKDAWLEVLDACGLPYMGGRALPLLMWLATTTVSLHGLQVSPALS